MKSSKLNFGLSYVRRSPYQAFAVVLVMAVSFFIISLLATAMYGSEQVLRYFETRPQIIAFLSETASGEDLNQLEEKIRSDNRIENFKKITKDEAFEIYKKATSDNPLLSQLVSPSVFPASFEFSAKDLSYAKEIVAELQGNELIDNVGFTASVGNREELGQVIERIRGVTSGIRIAGIIAAVVLIFTSFMVLMVIMSLRISARKSEIESMSLLGATAWFIRAPILIEAYVYAFFGTLIGFMVSVVVVLYSSPRIFSYLSPIEILPKNPSQLATLLLGLLVIELISSFIIATAGAWVAVSRHLKFLR